MEIPSCCDFSASVLCSDFGICSFSALMVFRTVIDPRKAQTSKVAKNATNVLIAIPLIIINRSSSVLPEKS